MAKHLPSIDEIADRISAYVYGNILTLAALVVLHADEIEHGVGLAIVAGTALSTYTAHVYAERLGAEARGTAHASWRTVLRDSNPILTSAAVPAVLMIVGSLEWASPTLCLRVAEAWVVARLGLTGFIVGRLRREPVTIRTWVASIGLALVALVIVAVKVALTH
ncbi:MAG: hypothetical protein JWR55_2515 [Aeromicrobium sp.]|nr:hypothetical protein [Aeromicrobium sp.]